MAEWLGGHRCVRCQSTVDGGIGYLQSRMSAHSCAAISDLVSGWALHQPDDALIDAV